METTVPKNHELRIEVSDTQKMKLMVTNGLAEIFGQELLNEKWYAFSGIRCSIFSFTGAVLRVEGNWDLCYVGKSSCFQSIFNYFDTVKDSSETVFVLGAGRTTFSIAMANYFVRIHRKMDFIEIDPGKGNIFPGALSYMQIDALVEYNERLKLNNPFCLFFGSLAIDNIELYEIQLERLQEEIESRNSGNFKIVYCPDVTNEMLNRLIRVFKATHVVCVGNERLFHRLNLQIPKTFIQNTGYVQENIVFKSISRYFNGCDGEYTPSSFLLKGECSILRVGEQYAAPESALPLGATRKIGHTDVCKCELVHNAVLAISEAETEEQVIRSPALGFLVCLDEKKQRVWCTQGKLPKCKYLIQGAIKHIDS